MDPLSGCRRPPAASSGLPLAARSVVPGRRQGLRLSPRPGAGHLHDSRRRLASLAPARPRPTWSQNGRRIASPRTQSSSTRSSALSASVFRADPPLTAPAKRGRTGPALGALGAVEHDDRRRTPIGDIAAVGAPPLTGLVANRAALPALDRGHPSIFVPARHVSPRLRMAQRPSASYWPFRQKRERPASGPSTGEACARREACGIGGLRAHLDSSVD
jgi:hypothetical protein